MRSSAVIARKFSQSLTLLALAAATAGAQTNFGSVNLGNSAPATVTLTIPNAIMLGSIAVVTQGASGLDFTNAATGTCTAGASYSSSQTCTVDVNFKPLYAGMRFGAVLLKDPSGNVIVNSSLVGIGMGPQIAFDPGAVAAIAPMVNGTALKVPFDPVVDGKGDLFITDTIHARVVEIPAGGGAPLAIDPLVNGHGLVTPGGVAMDGAGDLFISDLDGDFVMEVPASGAAPTLIDPTVNGQSLAYPCGMVIDGAGNLFIADVDRSRVVEIPAGGGSAIAIDPTVNGKSLSYPVTLALDAAGDLFIADEFGNRVVEVPDAAENPAGTGATAIAPTANGQTIYQPYGVAVDAAGDLFIADAGNNRIVEVPAGGAAPAAFNPTANGKGLSDPIGIALDPAGDLFIADSLNNRVVEVQRSQPPALNFAATSVGSTSSDSPQTVEVENIGNAALTFPVPATGNNPVLSSSFTLNSSGTPDCPLLTSGSSAPATLAAGASCLLPISFQPTAAGTIYGTLTLTDDTLSATAPAYATQTIPLSGNAPVASLSAASLSFGPQQVSTASASQQVTLTNTGSAALSIANIAVNGANASAFLFPDPCGSSLAAGANCVIQGTFTPSSSGAMSAAISITDNAGGSPQSITLTGAGVYVPTVTATPSSSSITTAQALSVTVAVSGESGNPSPTGSVTLAIGLYSSLPVALSSGSASIIVPAGSLAVGTDSIVATYAPDNASSVLYQGASGSSSVTVTAAQTATAPTATTTAASAITANSATLAGTVTPNGADTHAWFLYGTSSTLSGASQTASQDLGSGNSPVAVSYAIPPGLSPNTTYYYQVVAQNSVGTTAGTIFSFTTIPSPYFTLSNGTAVSVAPGATVGNTSTITVTPWYGFTGNATLTAAVTSSPTGAVSPPTLSFGSTSPVAITGAGPGSATLTISTTPAFVGCSAANSGDREPPWVAAGSAVLACVLFFGIPVRRRWLSRLGMVALLVALAGGVLACGGSGEKTCSAVVGPPATTAGSYTITITGASGSATAPAATVALTVQ